MKPQWKATVWTAFVIVAFAIVIGCSLLVSWAIDVIGGWALVILGVIVCGMIWTVIYISLK